MRRFEVGVLAVFFVLLAVRPARAEDIFYIETSPLSTVGRGETITLASPDATFTTYRFFDQGVNTNGVNIRAGDEGRTLDLTLVGPNNSLPTVGFYDNATRFPFMGQGPGLTLISQAGGYNTVNGWFNVLQADYNADGSVRAFAVNFEQHGEGNSVMWERGAVRYNSPIPIPEPAAIALPILLALLRRRPRGVSSRIRSAADATGLLTPPPARSTRKLRRPVFTGAGSRGTA